MSKLEKIAGYFTLTVLSLVVIFHILVLSGVIPYSIVWGGRLSSHEDMVQFELVSIITNLLMLAVIVIRVGIIKTTKNYWLIKIILWIIFALLVLNTVGNTIAETDLEKFIFTPMTALLAASTFILAYRYKKPSPLKQDK